MDKEASPIATSSKDALGVPSSVCPTADTTTCTDDDFGRAVSAYDVAAAPGHAMSAMDASGMSSSICPTRVAATCVDDGFGYVAFVSDVVATLGRTMPATGAPNVPSSICSPVDVAISCASPVDAMATPAPLPLTS